VLRGSCTRQLDQLALGLWCGDPSQCARFRVRHLALAHRLREHRQALERSGHAHPFARGARIEAGAPGQPVRAGLRAVVAPTFPFVEFAQADQQLVGRGLDLRRDDRDLVAETVDLGHSPFVFRDSRVISAARFAGSASIGGVVHAGSFVVEAPG
jgi:hypothetical protein